MHKTKIIKLLFGAMTLLFIACDRKEACLDVWAKDFDVEADESCDGCCTYPSLSLDFKHLFIVGTDTSNFDYEKTYVNNLSQSFQVKSLQFYISEVVLIQENGTKIAVIDTIHAKNLAGEDKWFVDDFVLISRNAFKYEVGKIKAGGVFKALEFKLGLSATANQISPTSVNTSHALSSSKNMYQDNSYIFNEIVLYPDVNNLNNVKTLQIGSPVIEISLPYSFSHQKGQDLNIPLVIDYAKFFRNITFNAQSDAQIKQSISENSEEVFFIKK